MAESVPNPEPTVELLDALTRLIRTSRAANQRQQAEYAISGTPLGILSTLADGDARSTDLAARLQIAPSVVSRAIVPLEQAGLLERRADPNDARASRLGLTAAGRDRLEEARRDLAERFAPLVEDWDAVEVATLTRLMRRLESSLGHRVDLAGHERALSAADLAARS